MKKIIIVLVLLVTVLFSAQAKDKTNTRLQFNENGKFKILQFTDIHFQYNSYRSDSVLMMMKAAVETEHPDLVVLTGDVVCSDNTREAWLMLTRILVDSKVPWAVTLGNHDIEYELTGAEIIKTIAGLPYSVTQNGPKNLSGSGNYILKVAGSKSRDTEAVLYFIDSHSGLNNENGWGGYDWIKFDQVQWYREQSKKLTRENGGKPYPALAFFHIPLPEYKEVWSKATTVGVKEEDVCSPDINTGMFSAFLESGDVMGMFVGHDHVNNYIGTLRNIALVYGQSSGRETYGDIGKGYRVIELYEGQRKFDTWIRIKYKANQDEDLWEPTHINEKQNFVSFPDSFSEN